MARKIEEVDDGDDLLDAKAVCEELKCSMRTLFKLMKDDADFPPPYRRTPAGKRQWKRRLIRAYIDVVAGRRVSKSSSPSMTALPLRS